MINMPLTKRVESEKELAEYAAGLLPVLRRGDVLCLKAGLGAGKTAFARALIQVAAGMAEEVPSPTFTLVQVYDLPRFSFWHFDLYRLEGKENDILELNWDDARRFGIALVEWPERLGGLLPADRLEIDIDLVKDSENSRLICLRPCGAWAGRLQEG